MAEIPEEIALRDAEKKLFRDNPLSLLRSGYLRIKTKDGQLLPLKLNRSQEKILHACNEQRKKKLPVRLGIVKFRQGGASTLIESVIFSLTSQRPNLNSLIISLDDDGSNYLFEMSKLYHEQLTADHPHLSPQRKYSNEKKLEFMNKHSLILIDSAQNKRAGRSYTFQNAHVSEAAYFPDFANTMLALSQAVPDEPETFLFVESTANGEDNDFCRWYRKIKAAFKNGDTTWIPLFLSWKDHEEYTRKFITPSEREHFVNTMSSDEKRIMSKFDLTLEQMNWRRRTVIDKCNGDPKKFQQEYPLDDDEAFLSTSRRVFSEEHTAPQEKNIVNDPLRGELEWLENRPRFVAQEAGDLRVYDAPRKGHRYVMAIDASEGILGGDFGVVQIIDRSTWSQAAMYRSQCRPDVLARKAFNLGIWYNCALAVPEINGPGLVTTLGLRDLNYPNIVHRTAINVDAGEIKETDELGWHTNSKTKPILISDLESALREILLVVKDQQTLDEIKRFVVKEITDSGYTVYGAAPGAHDDCVITLAMAVHFAKTMPESYTSMSSTQEGPRSTRITGY